MIKHYLRLIMPWVPVIMVVIMILLLFSSCSTVQKAKQTLNDNPRDAAEYCADKFPVKDSIVIRDSITTDTIYQGETFFDTVYTTDTDTVTRTVTKVLPGKIITNTVTQVKEVFRENTATVAALQITVSDCLNEVNRKDKAITETTDSRDTWKKKAKQRWWIIIALVALLLRKPLLKLLPWKIPLISK